MTNEKALEILKSIEILSFRDKKRKYFMRDVWQAQKVAIKALEQQQDVHDTCKNCIEFSEFEQQARWIPVSERLPEEDGFYLATLDGEICGEDKPFSGLAEFENGKWVDDEEDYQCVIAWMPLPQPYKAESEDKE